MRLLHPDKTGALCDATLDPDLGGFGLTSLRRQASSAAEGVVKVRELLELLALASEEQSAVPAHLVQRVVSEILIELRKSGEVGSFVQHIDELLEHAEPLPPVDSPASMSLTAA